MDMTLFVCLLFLLQFFYWIVGRRAAKNISGRDEYFLAGRSVGLFPLMMTFIATIVGGGVVLGAAEEAFLYGWPVLMYPLGGALGMILLGAGVGRKLAGFQVSTVAQIFEVVYRSSMLRKMASILSVISLFMILVAQIVASSKFLVSVGFNNTPLFLVFWAIVILYTVQGGLRAVISTDMVQALFFSAVFLLCFGFVLYSTPSAASIQLPQLESFTQVSSKLYGWVLMPLFFMVIEQDMGQRCFAGASPKIVSRASLLAGVVIMIVCIVPVFFGCLANTMGLKVPEGSSVLMTAITATTNPRISALVGCAVLAAIISTATSLINAISSNLAADFQFSFLQKGKSMRRVQGITCAISIAAILWAFYFDNIVDLLIQSYELSVSCLFIPIIFALFKKQGNFLAALFSILLGASGFVLFRLFPIEFPREIAGILLSLAGFVCGEMWVYCNADTKLTSLMRG